MPLHRYRCCRHEFDNLFSCCSKLGEKVDRVTPSNARPLNPGLAELRRKLGICTFPAEDVLNALRSTAASDGKLTRSVRPLMRSIEPYSTPENPFDSLACSGPMGNIICGRLLFVPLCCTNDGTALLRIRTTELNQAGDIVAKAVLLTCNYSCRTFSGPSSMSF